MGMAKTAMMHEVNHTSDGSVVWEGTIVGQPAAGPYTPKESHQNSYKPTDQGLMQASLLEFKIFMLVFHYILENVTHIPGAVNN